MFNFKDPYACGGGTYYTSFNWFESISELLITFTIWLSLYNVIILLASFFINPKVWGSAVLCPEPWLPSWACQPGGARPDQAAPCYQWEPSLNNTSIATILKIIILIIVLFIKDISSWWRRRLHQLLAGWQRLLRFGTIFNIITITIIFTITIIVTIITTNGFKI